MEIKPQDWTNIHLCQPKYSNGIGVKTDKQKKNRLSHISRNTFRKSFAKPICLISESMIIFTRPNGQ